MLSLLYEPDRELRRARRATRSRAGLRANARLLAFVFNTLVQDKADARPPAPLRDADATTRHLANEIDAASVDALLTACERALPLVARYYRLKAQPARAAAARGLRPLRAARRRRTASAASTRRARIVLDAYGDFSPRARRRSPARFFERRWIDAELRPGKRGGAFCASTRAERPPLRAAQLHRQRCAT